jgi:nitrogenase molybdenum-iron protein NifN
MIKEAELCKSCSPKEDVCPSTKGVLEHATQNACKLCAPLGAALAFAGIEGCISILHGSQGCATYIRRYLISHFREPMDIASSSFSEQEAVFGGGRNLKTGIDNLKSAYSPTVVGVATTCLAETIGEDVPGILREYREGKPVEEEMPFLIHVSTPSYSGDHWEGFHKTTRAIVEQVHALGESEEPACRPEPVLMLPGMLSCEDLRHLKELCRLCELPVVLLPDYSDTLDGGSWSSYQRIPRGGTSIAQVRQALHGHTILALGDVSANAAGSAGRYLEEECGSGLHALGLPMGIRGTDQFMKTLAELSGVPMPSALEDARSRLIDSYVDGHKYLSGKTAVVFADPDLLVGMASMIAETGVRVLAAASGSTGMGAKARITEVLAGYPATAGTQVRTGLDYAGIAALCRELEPDIILGNSKAYPIARELDIPLLRFGMPIHDRIGAQRTLHLGYAGAQAFFDTLVNTLLQHRQDENEIGFAYL